jgi:glycerophosphoryl diester phosphodiesterase
MRLNTKERAAAAEKVHFNLETKILSDRLPPAVAGNQDVRVPAEMFQNQTVGPQTFVDALCGAIKRNHMDSRADVQSFDYRTLILIEEQYPNIPTYYLIDNANILTSEFVPEPLRQAAKR